MASFHATIKTRVIPLLLLKDGLLKKPVKFNNPRTVANPIAIARVFESRQVDELILLDIGCTEHNANVNPAIVRMISEELTVPFTCGGGIRSVETMARLIAAGAEKVVINTAAFETPDLISDGAQKFGRQCVVVSIDAKREASGKYQVYIRNGTEPAGCAAADWAREAERRGAGEILINCIDCDGVMAGYELPLIRDVADAVDVPVIAAGGAGELMHFPLAIIDGHAAAVAAGSIYHYTRVTPDMVKQALREEGIPVRLSETFPEKN